MMKPMLYYQHFDHMVIKVQFDMTLTFDLKEYICILLFVVDYIVDHVKFNCLPPIYCEI